MHHTGGIIGTVITAHKTGGKGASFFPEGGMDKSHHLGWISIDEDDIRLLTGTAYRSDEDILVAA
jgi:hypothetical protein